MEELEKLNETVENFDITCADGVLTIRLGRHGTYVVNKQTPNRQLWLSSPVSGPKRYSFAAAAGQWQNARDGHSLARLLAEEIAQLTGQQLQLQDTQT